MARADLILTLVKASRQGDDLQVRKAVEALAAEERAKNHTILADRLLAQLQSGNGRYAQQSTRLINHSASNPLVAETAPHRCLDDLFFDEFDSVGKERGDLHETGEIKRVVSSLLLQIDALPSYVVVVTASNHPELLDRAAWRRFQIRLELPAPTQGQIEEWFRRFEKRHKQPLGLSPRSFAQRLRGLSFAEVEDFGTDILRQITLQQPGADVNAIVERRLRHWKKRYHE